MENKKNMKKCNGNGECLTEVDGPYGYTKKKDVECVFSCAPKKCKKYDFCESISPAWVLDLKNGMCTDCHFVSNCNKNYKRCKKCKTVASAWFLETNNNLCVFCIPEEIN